MLLSNTTYAMRKQDQSLKQLGVNKILAEEPNGDIALLSMRFIPATFRVRTCCPYLVTHVSHADWIQWTSGSALKVNPPTPA